MQNKPKQRIKVTIDRKRFRWTLVGAALLLLIISVGAAWGYYQKILAQQPHFTPVSNQTMQALENATDNFTIGR